MPHSPNLDQRDREPDSRTDFLALADLAWDTDAEQIARTKRDDDWPGTYRREHDLPSRRTHKQR